MQNLVAIIDDDDQLRYTIKQVLSFEDVEILEADNGSDGVKLVQEHQPNLVFLDVNLPDAFGIDLLKKFQQEFPSIPVIVITAQANVDVTVQALKNGAYDFLPKPFDSTKLRVTVKNALANLNLQAEIEKLRSQVSQTSPNMGRMVGASPEIQQIFNLIDRAKDANVTVFIQGESGTGKEMIAKEIHSSSNRSGEPFVVVNCGAIPETLIESELFGHEKGSFTGADEVQIGKFEQASGGTIFLDEIGDMPINTQVKILRVLQERELQRIGGSETIPIDVKVISATNKDLKIMISENTFREDLYYRLTVFPINVPPLRVRKADIPALCAMFIKKHAPEVNPLVTDLSRGVMEAFLNYSWPGNIRELENAIQRGMVLAQKNQIDLQDIPAEIRPTLNPQTFQSPVQSDIIVPLEDVEKQVLQHALTLTKGNISKASQALKIDRTTLHRKIRKYGLDLE